MKLRRPRHIQLVVTKPITVKVNGQRQELNYGSSVAYRDNSREVLVTHLSVSIEGRAIVGPKYRGARGSTRRKTCLKLS